MVLVTTVELQMLHYIINQLSAKVGLEEYGFVDAEEKSKAQTGFAAFFQ